MIPGKKSCFAGWKKEYDGIIASGAYSHAASSFICIDAHPSYITGGSRSNSDNLPDIVLLLSSGLLGRHNILDAPPV
jgi:hypothetical protein